MEITRVETLVAEANRLDAMRAALLKEADALAGRMDEAVQPFKDEMDALDRRADELSAMQRTTRDLLQAALGIGQADPSQEG